MKELNEMELLRAIKKVNGVSVKGNIISINRNNHSAGLRTWTKIEVLKRNFGYSYMFVDNIESKEISKDIDREERKTKRQIKEQKTKIKLPKLNFKKL